MEIQMLAQFTYDENNNLISVTLPNGDIHKFNHDKNNNVKSRSYKDRLEVTENGEVILTINK